MDWALFIIAMVIALVGGLAFIYIAVKTVKASHEFSELDNRINEVSELQRELAEELKKLP